MAETAILLDDNRLVSQISQLERRTTRSGRDSIDHMRGAYDDLANAALGALVNVPSIHRVQWASSTPKAILGYESAKRLQRRRQSQRRF